MKEKDSQPRILYLAKLCFKNEDKITILKDKILKDNIRAFFWYFFLLFDLKDSCINNHITMLMGL